jgi:Cellulase (glycosyl hydrolase family 5)
VPRKPLIGLLVVVVAMLAGAAGSARAVGRMPIGFFDDPSFRWSTQTERNIAAAQAANASIIHVLVNWASVAPAKPANPLNGNDPAYHLSDIDTLVRTAPKFGFQILMTITNTPAWANGGKPTNYPPTDLNTLTQFCQMLATRYNGSKQGTGVVTRFSIWNEPNLEIFLAPQFNGSKIVSAAEYAKLFMAGYKGIKAGNPTALVAAGETSNRGHNHPTSPASNDSVAPATFAHLVSEANPKLPFDAWATHPYPSVYSLGPAQRVAYPNVSFSTINRFGADLAKWFHRPVPVWVTEYGEQTAPAPSKFGPVSLALQAAHAKQALQLAAASPYVQMFVWFIFRDSSTQTWFSGLQQVSGAKKPSYNAFKSTAAGIVGQSQVVAPNKKFSVKVAVPILAYYNAAGAKIGVTYKVLIGKTLYAIGQPLVSMARDGTITINVKFAPAKGQTYTLNVVASDKGGRYETTNALLLPG